MKYVIYARKSSESEDRQVQSIQDQIDRLKALATNQGLNIVKIYEESKSAKDPLKRPYFEEMMTRLDKGEIQGILCWQLNRLSRNPVDSGRIQWMLQRSVIKSIQTTERDYRPEDNVLLFSVESGMANQYVLELSRNVKRGLQSKVQKGIYPGMPPMGYLIDPDTKEIIEDPERFHLVRKMWDLMLSGSYTTPQVLKIANDEWGYRTRKTRRIGGNPMTRSGIYKMMTSIFYTGFFEYNGEQYQGKHKAMITLDEFDLVQRHLGRLGRPRPKTREFSFTGLIRCGECGCVYTAEDKFKKLKNGEVRKHTYYHCTRKKTTIDCTQKKNIRLEDLEAQIEKELSQITILPQFRDWALEILAKQNDKEIVERTKIYENQQKALNKVQSELDNLTRMRYRDLVTDEEYSKEKTVLKEELERLKQHLHQTEQRAEHWLELTEKTFDFATYARHAFITGDVRTKKEIFAALGQNFKIEHEKLTVELHKWFVPIKNVYAGLEEKFSLSIKKGGR